MEVALTQPSPAERERDHTALGRTVGRPLVRLKGGLVSGDEKDRMREVIKRLRRSYPDPKTALDYTTPFELLAATILSAQTTDAQVNKVTAGLFRKYRTVQDYAAAPLDELKKDVSSVNFYNNKAKNIQGAARMILDSFGGEVPDSMEGLTSLPGVARKTANILLWNVFGKNEGVAVDTHVMRLSQRLGLTKQSDPVKIEQDLMALAPKKDWGLLTHLLILHGRQICHAKKPRHKECVLADLCPSRDI